MNGWTGGVFCKQRYKINSTFYPFGHKYSYAYTVLSRDKILTEMLCQGVLGRGDYAESFAFYDGYKRFWIKNKKRGGLDITGSFQEEIEKRDGQKIVFKQYYGSDSNLVKFVEVNGDKILDGDNSYSYQEFFEKIYDRRSLWCIQDYIKQHPVLSMLNDTSVNTMRILSYNTGDRVIVDKAVMRVGQKGSMVDNAATGGYIIPITDEGKLGEDMFVRKPLPKRFNNTHAELKIPFWGEAIALVEKIHSFIPELFSLGWDVTITENGPMLIEVNDGWDTKVTQVPIGNAQRRKFFDYMHEREDYYGIKYFD